MRRFLPFVCCLNLAAADISELQQLTENRRFFDLRRALDKPGWNATETLFYRAEVASRGGHEMDGIKLFEEALASHPTREIARKTHEEMAEACERLGRYRDAAQQWGEALQLTAVSDSDHKDNENARVLMGSLSDVPPQTADIGEDQPIQASRNGLGSWNVPVTVNGVKGDWIFDTGANTSTITESEAKRMGLTVHRTKAYVGGSTDKKNALQLAVAKELQFGGARIHNVVFLVLTDQSLHIDAVRYQITGILGFPVLRALGRVGISSAGQVQIHPQTAAPAGTPNVFLEGATPIVEVDHNQHHLQMFLDTGSNASFLYPSVRGTLQPEETARLRTKTEKMGGAGGVIERKTEVVPTLRLDILGKTIDLKDLSLLREMPSDPRRYRDGVIGMDALWNGFAVDFGAMRFEIQPTSPH